MNAAQEKQNAADAANTLEVGMLMFARLNINVAKLKAKEKVERGAVTKMKTKDSALPNLLTKGSPIGRR